ncbi:MAG: preprotein translocase subunit SecG [Candidatus Blackburnbacteria bacterium]|nr:preprotein translocase subunit SecG [Candidatus Blackburnbacteria bacterium]
MSILTILQTILAVFLVVFILFQNRGAGLGSSWGGSGEFYSTRRGFEKIFFKATIVVAAFFIIVSFLSLLI